jgi:hypothetical protein
MQIPFFVSTDGNPELSEKPQAGIWVADRSLGQSADESDLRVGPFLHTS